jgi:hypothetical protein
MTKNWMSTALAAGLAALLGSAAEAREHPPMPEGERSSKQSTQTTGRSDGEIIVAGNSSSNSSSNGSDRSYRAGGLWHRR